MSLKDAGSAACQEKGVYHLLIYPQLSTESAACCRVTATKDTTTSDVIKNVIANLNLDVTKCYVLVEVKESGGEEWVLDANDPPVHRVLLWPRRAQDEHPQRDGYYFLLQERNKDGTIKYVHMQLFSEAKEARRLVERGFLPWQQEDFDDLCNLPNLTETNLLKNLKHRFLQHKIYTYAGSILVAINPFKFLPIYNPKYVKMYENQQLGKLEPHIFAIADVAYFTMLKKHINQCIVISGESGSGKTQSTNFLIHCLTALSQKGYASGVERIILGAGLVLEAFGNAKTAHNNNSSRFGKFIQVNYLESGIVRGAVVEKYLLEKSRLVSQEKDERNYHVFYYLLLGVTEEERQEFQLKQPEDYFYLNQHNLKIEDGEDLRHDFERLKQAMEMVGFLPATKKQIFSVLSAILYLGNVTYKKRATGRDEGLEVGPPEVLDTLSQLLKVKREILVEVLTKRKTVTANDKLILPYSLSEAKTARDSMAKSLYSALFDWIVLRINHALLNKKDMEESVTCLSIGVLDIFGFEDFETNSFEQFCINYANEQLQYYFNQHIFKLEQEEYQSEGITWHNIDYTDNVGCIHLISKKPTGLFYLLDEESNFPHATSQTLLAKFKQQHEENKFFVGTPVMEPAFIIQHFAGKVKYQIKDFREKNMDYMRPDIVALLRSSDSYYIRELIGMDPVAVFRWAILRAAIRAMAVFREAGRLRAERTEKTAGMVPLGLRTPVGDLQRANTPTEKVYRHSVLDFSFDCSEDFDINAFEDIIAFYESKKKSKGIKQKQIIPKNLLDSKSLKLIVSMTLHDRTTKSLLHLHKKKKPPSISAQFQASLNKLLETLGKAEPFFIRCIRANAEKKELCFDEELVLQQLRYTGMLETVRIRRSGYSAKYTFQDFMDQFQVLLPKDARPSKETISALLEKMDIDKKNYQIGKTKVFMKETERQKLQETLHKEVIRKIILLQSWVRVVLERRHFLQVKQAAITIQACWRSYQVRRALERVNAAVYIQSFWKGYRQRRAYQHERRRIVFLQNLFRGFLQRKSFRQMVLEKRKAEEKKWEMQQIQNRDDAEIVSGQAETGEQMSEQMTVRSKVKLDLVSELENQLSDISIAGGDAKQTAETGKGSQDNEMAPSFQKSVVESHEKVASSREKRETRRQRGLEHVKFQNKHIQSYKEESSISEAPAKTVQEQDECIQEQDISQDRIHSEIKVSHEIVALDDLSKEKPEELKEEVSDNKVLDAVKVEEYQKEQQKGSESSSNLERPSSLPLSGEINLPCAKGPPEHHEGKNKPSAGQKANEDQDSRTATQIQRYRETDSDKLVNVLEVWRGKKWAAGQNTVLSQSLEEQISEKFRTASSPQRSVEETGTPSTVSEVCKIVPSSTKSQPAADVIDTEKSTKKQVIQKKKSNEQSAQVDGGPAGLSPGQQAETKSTFKRLFLPKKQDKKNTSEVMEEGENFTPTAHVAVDVVVVKKVAEAPPGPQNRPQAGERERHAKEPGSKAKKNRNIKIGKITTVSEKWRDSVFRKITNANELKYLDEFLLNKINDLCSQKTPIEILFNEATEKFRSNIKSMYSVPNGKIHVGYKDLMENYQIVVTNLALEKGEKDTNLVLNIFQSLLDEFSRGYIKRDDSEPPKQSKAQKKKRKQDRAIQEHNGHVFTSYQVSIPQSCEHCLSFIWPMDKALLCNVCKMACHKKCVSKIQSFCASSCGKKSEPGAELRHFGVCVSSLTSDKVSVPVVLEKLLEHVEMHGLYTEGIYRKSGAANRMRELKQSLQSDPNSVKLENYPIHAITGVLKLWLRELPEPLMTFSQYNDFLKAVELPAKQEQLTAIYTVLDQLPEANHLSLERLIFHLVKVAEIEEVNRMSPSALAIVFAPCLLRCPDNSDPLTSMKDVLKTTTCVEMIIKEQLRKYKIKMEEINQLEAAETIAFRRLSFLKQNTSKSPKIKASDSNLANLGILQEEQLDADDDREKEILIEHIQSIKEEKEDIAYRLPELDQRGSDEENPDSETSVSTESLLDEKSGRVDTEGTASPGLPCCGIPTKDIPETASRSHPLILPSRYPDSSSVKKRATSMTVRMKIPRRTPIMPTSNIKLPYGMLTNVQRRTSTGEEAVALVKRREQPARRTDPIHSVYIAAGADSIPAQEPLNEYGLVAETKRRYSDPPVYSLGPQ